MKESKKYHRISKEYPLTLAAICLLCLSVFSSCKGPGKEYSRPNVILIISDDQGWTDYGFMGHPHIETPNIDRLASEGLTFTRGYVAAPLCRPSLASLSTGLYPHQHRVLGNDPVVPPEELINSESRRVARSKVNQRVIERFSQLPNLARLLSDSGYATLQTGKWWEGHPENGGYQEAMTHGDPARGGRHGDEGLTIGREGLDPVFDFIDRAVVKDQPFFVWYAPFMPHSPHTPPDSLYQKYLPLAPSQPVAYYWAMCEWFDHTCGQLMDYIGEKGLEENTLFVYVCDNGWIQDEERRNRYAPKSKRTPFEMGIRTPIMYRWTGTIEPKMDTTTLASSTDIAPGILSVCGIDPPTGMAGINMMDPQARANRKEIFSETYLHDFSDIDSSLLFRVVLRYPWKLILPNPENLDEAEAAYTGDTLLYNIASDPFEQDDVYSSHPEQAGDLLESLENWWNE